MNSQSNTANKNQAPTPWHLWLIAGLLVMWNGLATFDFLATAFRFEPYLSQFSDELLAHYYAAPVWMFGMWGIGALGGFASAVLLLMRNKLAVPVFAVSLMAAVIAQIYGAFNPAPDGSTNLIFSAFIIVVAALVLIYAHRMKQRGILR